MNKVVLARDVEGEMRMLEAELVSLPVHRMFISISATRERIYRELNILESLTKCKCPCGVLIGFVSVPPISQTVECPNCHRHFINLALAAPKRPLTGAIPQSIHNYLRMVELSKAIAASIEEQPPEEHSKSLLEWVYELKGLIEPLEQKRVDKEYRDNVVKNLCPSWSILRGDYNA